jgi:hypothetical protein
MGYHPACMSVPREPEPARLVVSVIFRPSGDDGEPPWLREALSRLEGAFGRTDHAGPVMSFDATSYYVGEMGKPLRRRFYSFPTLVGRDRLAGIKRLTNGIEESLVDGEGRRRVNIDPGLIALENFILATGKGREHRIFLGSGIWADLTLVYRDGAFQPLAWTYPDYASDEIRSMLGSLRGRLVEELRSRRAAR